MTTASLRTTLTMLTSVAVGGSYRQLHPIRANEGTRPSGSDGGMDERIRGVKKETDGKEKESCCIRKLFIFLHGMVNTKEDADAFLLVSRSRNSAFMFQTKGCSFTNFSFININATK